MVGGSSYTYHSAFTPSWFLKLGPPLLSPHVSYPSYLPCLMTGVLGSCRQW